MVTVPVYGGQQVSARAGFQQGVNVQASGGAFGADIGQGMQQLGRGVGQAADALAQIQDFDDTQRAKDADTNFGNWARERMYGEGGFMTMEGRNAVDGRSAFEAEAEEKRKEFGQGLTGGAARSYDTASQSRIQTIYGQSITHTASARKQWFSDASSARLDTFAEDAVAGFRDPKTVDFNISAGQAEIREQGRMLGWDADMLANREKEYISSTRMNVALRMLDADPVLADKYYKEHKDQFTGPHQFKFEETMKMPLTQAHVLQHTNSFFSDGGSSYYAAIRTAESGGDDAAKNPLSTATGRYQFIEGTWNQLRRQFPSLGLTADGRTDPAQQERAIRAFTEQNAKTLSRGGVAISNGTLYAAHFLGAQGALDVLRAAPKSRLVDLVSEGVISANGFLRNMTVEQFGAWAERKGGGSGAPAQAQGSGAARGYSTIEPFLATIEDPTEREMTRKSIYARLDGQRKAEDQQREAAKASAFNLIETQNISPFDLPASMTTAIGMEGMSSLMSYWDKRSAGAEIRTDAVQFMELQEMYANDPAEFSKVDLFNYKNSLSETDWKQVSDWRQTSLTDQRKAREEGSDIGAAMSFARTQLAGVGLSTDGLKDREKEAMARRVAQFQMGLTEEMEAHRRNNNGQKPSQQDIQRMTNRLLLPVVIKTPGTFWDSNADGFAFETAYRADGTEVMTAPKVNDIPIDLRRGISMDLELELGRKPTEEEVVARYSAVVLDVQPVLTGGVGPQVVTDLGSAGFPIEYASGSGPSVSGSSPTQPSGGSSGGKSPAVPARDGGPERRSAPGGSETEGIYFDGMTQNPNR